MEKIIEVTGLHKFFGKIHAVNGLDFYVETGKLFAFLGPNGAGKSTTLDIICTFLKPDAGEVIVSGYRLGKDDHHIRSLIGAVFQDGLLDGLLTVEENLKTRGSFYGLSGKTLNHAVENAVEITNLSELLKRPYGKLSGGQRRRCDIARALVHAPQILFLDEPTTGLDPQTRKNIWETILTMQKRSGTTVFLTTHYMEEAASADYIVIIDDGQIATRDTPFALKETYASDKLILFGNDVKFMQSFLDEQTFPYIANGSQLTVSIPDTLSALPIVEACKNYISGFEVVGGTMDDVFIAVTGKELRE